MATQYPTMPASDGLHVPTYLSWDAWCARLVREPLLRFMLAGALIFMAAHFAQTWRVGTSQRIVVDPRVEERLIAISQLQDGVTPGPKQLAALVNQYVEDEVLYREALRRGLGRDDEIVRRRLIQKMRYIEHDLAVPPVPSEAVLRAYYASHTALFTEPERAGFEQIYFSPDRDGWIGARARALRVRTELSRGLLVNRTTSLARIGDPFPAQVPPGELTREDANRLFGATGIVAALFDDKPGQWSQPLRSGYGWHLIKISHRSPSRLAPFSEVGDQVQADWTQEQAQRRERRELDALRARYQVVRAGYHTEQDR